LKGVEGESETQITRPKTIPEDPGSPDLAEMPVCDDHTDDGEQNGEDNHSCPVDGSDKAIGNQCPEQAAEYADDATFTPDRLSHVATFRLCIFISLPSFDTPDNGDSTR
jgi:hypothetical protein